MVPILVEVNESVAGVAFSLISKLLKRRKIVHSINIQNHKCWRFKPHVVEAVVWSPAIQHSMVWTDPLTGDSYLNALPEIPHIRIDDGQMILKWSDGRYIVCDRQDFETNFEQGYAS